MVVGKTFIINLHNLSIDECINLLALKQCQDLTDVIKDLIITKILIKVISERSPIFTYNHLIHNIIYRIDRYCRKKFSEIQNEYEEEKEEKEELLKRFGEFEQSHATKYYDKKEILFIIFYAERAIIELYY
jgi:hypothetical protein